MCRVLFVATFERRPLVFCEIRRELRFFFSITGSEGVSRSSSTRTVRRSSGFFGFADILCRRTFVKFDENVGTSFVFRFRDIYTRVFFFFYRIRRALDLFLVIFKRHFYKI